MAIEKNKNAVVLSILLTTIAHSAMAQPSNSLNLILDDYEALNSNQNLPITRRSLDPDAYYVQVDASAGNKRYSSPVFERKYMPSDLRNIRVNEKRISKGFQTPIELMATKDALSSYLYQDKNAGILYGLYCQRMLAFNNGLPSVKNITVDQAIKEEQYFDFLNQTVNSQSNSESIIRYYNQRLNTRDAGKLLKWFEVYASQPTEQTVKQILEFN